jgi:hypothetical protein
MTAGKSINARAELRAKYMKMNAIQITPSEKVDEAIYFDSLKFWGSLMVKTARTLLATISRVQ